MLSCGCGCDFACGLLIAVDDGQPSKHRTADGVLSAMIVDCSIVPLAVNSCIVDDTNKIY